MNIKVILTALMFLPLTVFSQELTTDVSAEIKATGDNPLRPVGEINGRLYYLKPGWGRNLDDYSLLSYAANDLSAAPEETPLNKVFPQIKAHDVAYAFVQSEKIYLVTISKDQYFGSIITTDKTAEKVNVALYKTGMTKATIDFAEVSQTADKKQLVLMYAKVPKGKVKEYGFITYDQDWNKLEDHLVKIPDAVESARTTGMLYSSSGKFYVAASNDFQGFAYVYDSKTKKAIPFPLEDQDDKNGYANGTFHEGPDGSVWLPYTYETDLVTHYSLFRHKPSDETPVLVEHHEFAEQTLSNSRRKQRVGKQPLGIYRETSARQMIFAKSGKIYLVFECIYGDKIESLSESTSGSYLDIICVTLNSDGKATDEASIHKNQIVVIAGPSIKRWTLGRRSYTADCHGSSLGMSMSFSFIAFEKNGKLNVLFNDARAAAGKNEPNPDMYNTASRASLVLVTVDGSSADKEIITANDSYGLVFLPRYSIQLSTGSVMGSVTSPKGGSTGAFLVKP